MFFISLYDINIRTHISLQLYDVLDKYLHIHILHLITAHTAVLTLRLGTVFWAPFYPTSRCFLDGGTTCSAAITNHSIIRGMMLTQIREQAWVPLRARARPVLGLDKGRRARKEARWRSGAESSGMR